MKEPLVSRILLIALYFVFIAGVVVAATLPFTLDKYYLLIYDKFMLEPGYRIFILSFLLSVAVPSLWIVLEMIWMLRSVPKGPFVMRNVSALNRIGVIFLLLAAAFIVKCFVYFTLLTLLCGLLFIGGGLFAFTFSALIRRAVEYKDEVDLTI